MDDEDFKDIRFKEQQPIAQSNLEAKFTLMFYSFELCTTGKEKVYICKMQVHITLPSLQASAGTQYIKTPAVQCTHWCLECLTPDQETKMNEPIIVACD